MKTEIYQIYSAEDTNIYTAAQLIKQGKIVALPTETVYGLGADATNADAVARIFAIKNRPADNPLIVHLADAEKLGEYARDIPQQAYDLLQAFSPGPLSVVLKKQPDIPDITTAGLDTVALRIPGHDVFRAIIKAAGTGIAAPSANISTRPSPTTAAHVLTDLDGRIDAIVDSGPCAVGIESTVVSFAGEHPVILRPGMITMQMIKTIITEIKELSGADDCRHSPGTRHKHYSPAAQMTALSGNTELFAAYIRSLPNADNSRIFCINGEQNIITGAIPYGGDAAQMARNLFAFLRSADGDGIKHIYIHAPDDTDEYRGLRNRIEKAAGGITELR